jgi:hypothetical protein
LDDHIKREHLKTAALHVCNHEGCNFSTPYANVLVLHQVTHSDERKFVCDFEGCTYSAKRADILDTHKLTHSDERQFACLWPGCGLAFKQRQSLGPHMDLHYGIKPVLLCDQCDFKTIYASRLSEHTNEVHLQIRPHVCVLCSFAAARPSQLRKHLHGKHKQGDALTCPMPQCDFQTYWEDSLAYHKRFGHTETGERVRNGEEYQTLSLFAASFDVERSFKINKQHLTGTGRRFINIDGAIHLPERNLVVFIEVDEQQHKDCTLYSIQEELNRMEDATEGMRHAGSSAHILWIRFNPNTYTVDGTRYNEPLASRVDKTKEFITSFQPVANEMNIVYAFYDMSGGKAIVTQIESFYTDFVDVTRVIV